jgi:hypothetical protein
VFLSEARFFDNWVDSLLRPLGFANGLGVEVLAEEGV